MSKPSITSRIQNLNSAQRTVLAEKIKQIRREKESESARSRLVAYIIGTKELDVGALKAYAKNWLPDYMVPDAVVQLNKFPRLPNGKIDFQALPEPDNQTNSKESYKPSSDETEQLLVTIWEEVLSFQPIGVQDNFFEVGGDSIVSIQIVAKAREAGLEITPDQLFENQTISKLATVVKRSTLTLSQESTDQSSSTEDQDEFADSGLSQKDLGRLFDQLNSKKDSDG